MRPRLTAPALLFLALAGSGDPLAAQVGTLREALERAVEVHPSLDRARARTDAAASALDGARSSRLPTLALHGSGIRFQEPMLVAPLHRFDPTTVPDFDETLLQGTLGVDWTLFDGGRRSAGIREAGARAGATEEGIREARAAVLQRTADAYLSALSARALLEAQTRREEALLTERDRAAQLVREGAAPDLELLRADAEFASARADRATASERLALAVATLERILELPPGSLEAEALAPAPLPRDPLPGPADVGAGLERVPAVAAAMAEVTAAEAGVAAARSAWLPTLSAVAGYNLFAGGSVSPVAEWQGGLRLSYPLFTGGARGSAVDANRADLREARARVEEVTEQAALAADAARAAEAEARSRADALAAAVERFAELARVERLALDEGVGLQSDWLRAEAGLFESRAGLAEARHRVLAARIAWARAVGRLDLDWITQLVEAGS